MRSELTSERLLSRARAGDELAFRELIEAAALQASFPGRQAG
jgi:hypothetical protein